jgi:hypothetical protein
MAHPWVGIQKLAVVPTLNTQFDPPLTSVDDFANIVMRRVLYDPHPSTGADRSLRAYISAISYGQALLEAKLFPYAFSNGFGVVEAAWQSLPPNHGFPYVLCVIPLADGHPHRIGWYTEVNQNGVTGVARVALYQGSRALKQHQITGVWAMEVLHGMAGLPDLYYVTPHMGDFDNMTYNAGTHCCAYLKQAAGWLPDIPTTPWGDWEREFSLHAIGLSPPPPTRVAAVAIKSVSSTNTYIVEVRLKADLYERGFAPLPTGPNEFRGLPSEGVIVYEVVGPIRLEQVYLRTSIALHPGQSFSTHGQFNPWGITVQVIEAIEGGMRVRITRKEEPIVVANV